jgi:SAM-dependent methyltransferase
MIYWPFFILLTCAELLLFSESALPHKAETPTVLLAILARNKAHTLPTYLKCIEDLDYEKKQISLYINTNNNSDSTEEILKNWMLEHQREYASIEMETHQVEGLDSDRPHEWNASRFLALARIRNRSLQKALQNHSDFYFVVDCDNFIAPQTLRYLVDKDKPIIAPLLKAIPEPNDIYSNYFCAVSSTGYYENHPDYMKIWSGTTKGTFEVPVVHCTYLIRKDVLPSLTYIDGSQDYEFVIFSREARKHQIAQFICNEQPFGTLIHFKTDVSLTEEKERFEKLLSSQESIYDHKPSCAAIFSKIYTDKIWGANNQGEGFSGPGSTIEHTGKYRAFLQKFLADHDIQSVVDAGCGCWEFSKTIDWTGIDYQGFDVVEAVIKRNKALYGSDTIQFKVGDGTKENVLPPADLLLCKEVLQHLSFEDIEKFLRNLKSYKYCLITNDIHPFGGKTMNGDIQSGSYRCLDLREPPFCLKAEEVLTYRAFPFLKQVLLIEPQSISEK